MLQRVIEDLIRAGISDIRVNSHHLPETVEDCLLVVAIRCKPDIPI